LVQLDYKDNEREARVTYRFPFSTPVATLFSDALYYHSMIAPLSNAVLFRINIRYGMSDRNHAPPASDSDVRRYLALFYRNGDESTAFWIPSPNMGYFETAGPYAGIRLDTSRPEVAALVEAFTVALAQRQIEWASFSYYNSPLEDLHSDLFNSRKETLYWRKRLSTVRLRRNAGYPYRSRRNPYPRR